MDLPAPVHGMSNVNLAVKNFFLKSGMEVKVVNTAPSYAASLFKTRVWFFTKFVHTLFCAVKLFLLLLFSKNAVVYRPINGGKGQVYDIVYLLVSRMFVKNIYIHHHSFDYLNEFSWLFKILHKVAGDNAVHIVLGERMSSKLSSIYQIEVSNVRVVSNLAYFDKEVVLNFDAREELVIGHLANLCVEKGVSVFIDICRELNRREVIFRALIAGPFADGEAEKVVKLGLSELPNLEYLGPVYGDSKSNFYGSIDVFVFPSMYRNEAEPLVLYEAAQYGAYVCGTRRGCMYDVISKLGGYSVEERDGLVSDLVDNIFTLYTKGSFSPSYREHFVAEFSSEQAKAKEALLGIFEEMESYALSKA